MDKSTIPQRLRHARIKAGYRSARAFAFKHKIAYVTYSQHETGKRQLSPEVIFKYSRFLKISPGWLLTGDGEIDLHEYPRDSLKKAHNKQLEAREPSPANFDYSSPAVFESSNNQQTYIDADLLGDIFTELNGVLKSLNTDMSDRHKIKICVELYQTVQTSHPEDNSKFDILKGLLNAIKSTQDVA